MLGVMFPLARLTAPGKTGLHLACTSISVLSHIEVSAARDIRVYDIYSQGVQIAHWLAPIRIYHGSGLSANRSNPLQAI
jgi:hypothetical protein